MSDSHQAGYTSYGQVEHDGQQYVVTSVAARSKYFLRTWQADAVGVDPVVSVRDPGAPTADWHQRYQSWPETKKIDLVNKSLGVFLEFEAGR